MLLYKISTQLLFLYIISTVVYSIYSMYSQIFMKKIEDVHTYIQTISRQHLQHKIKINLKKIKSLQHQEFFYEKKGKIDDVHTYIQTISRQHLQHKIKINLKKIKSLQHQEFFYEKKGKIDDVHTYIQTIFRQHLDFVPQN